MIHSTHWMGLNSSHMCSFEFHLMFHVFIFVATFHLLQSSFDLPLPLGKKQVSSPVSWPGANF